MLYYTVGQWRIFVTLVICGLFAGAWYGLMARTARFLQAGVWLNAFFDLLIALGIWLVICAGMLLSNYGEVRLYALAGAAIGFALYRLTVARLLNWLLSGAARIVRKSAAFLSGRELIKKIFR